MTYQDYQEYCSRMGFITCPLSEEQFNQCVEAGLTDFSIYGVGADVVADIDFDVALAHNLEEQNSDENIPYTHLR